MKSKRKARIGFTLIELLVVIAIIGLLMALLLPAVQKIRSRGDTVKASSQINQLATACAQFKAENGVYPPDNATDAAALFKTMYPRYTGANPTPASATSNGYMLMFLQGPSGTGWAIDQPSAPSASATTKKGPWVNLQASEISGGQVIDPWGTALKYRSSGGGGAYKAAPTGELTAYNDASGKPFNFGGVQIVSAGPNKSHGNGPNLPLSGNAGFDDLANFNSGYQLGARP